MKKKLIVALTLFTVLLAMACVMPMMTASADELADSTDKIGTMTVVYLRDNATGDGSDYANAVGTLEDAYMMLDLSKDCTIVVCGRYTHINARFTIGTPYTGSVTLTSCYGGYDYRTVGATFEFDPFRYVCWGETIFKNINFYTPGTNMLVVAQHNPVTVAEGVSIKGDKMTGGTINTAFCIVGGYQSGQDNPPAEDNSDTHITVMSGENIVIVPFSRQILGTYKGTAHIKIGGNAKVGVLHGFATYPDGVFLGSVECEITDNAYIKNFYGVTQDTNADSYTLIWKSGEIGAFNWVCPNTPSKAFYPAGDLTLYASDLVKGYEGYDSFIANFDKIQPIAQDPEYVQPANPDNKTPGKDILEAPVTTVTPKPPVDDPDDPTPGTAAPDTNSGADQTDEPTKPAFTRGGKDTASKTDPESQSTAGSSDGADSSVPTGTIVVIACVAVAAVAAVVVILVAVKKKKE